MILNGNQRGGGLKLAKHLTNMVENDHVELHELRGFSSQTLRGALQEADAISKGTQCKQYLFSLSLNPPETETVPIADFEQAIDDAEQKLRLDGQPRAIVFHEKNGRRHAHVVWSRIDVRQMKAINLPYYQSRLIELSKDLFLEHGWRLPDGLRDRQNRNPTNFSLAEWQQAKRAGKDARAIKRLFQEAWQISDTAAAFANALEEKGYYLARGDRRGYVAVDMQGEVYAVPRWSGAKTKDARAKLGDPKQLRSVDTTLKLIAQNMQPTLSRWEDDLARQHEDLNARHAKEKEALKEQQRLERQRIRAQQEKRRAVEAKRRQARFRTGLSGLWDRMRGAYKRMRAENEREAWQAHLRDQEQMDGVIFEHIDERRRLKRDFEKERTILISERRDLDADRSRFDAMRASQGDGSERGPNL